MKDKPNLLVRNHNSLLKSTFLVALCAGAMSATAALAQIKGSTLPVGGPTSEPAKPKAPPITSPSAAPPKAPFQMAPPAARPPVTQAAPSITDDGMSSLGKNTLNSKISILVLALDAADLRQAPNWEAPSDDAKDSKNASAMPASMLEKELAPQPADVANRPPGEAQMIAAPLRRVLMGAGAADVLDASLDGASVVRAINSARFSPRVIAMARGTMHQIDQQLLESSGSPVAIPAALQQDAITAITRIGQGLGYRAVVAVVASASSTPGAPRALILLVDCEEQTGEIIPVSIPGQPNNMQDANNVAAAAGALLLPRLSKWSPSRSATKSAMAATYLQDAKDAAAKNNLPAAQDYINQMIGLQPNNTSAYVTLGDLLEKPAPQAAAMAYGRALDITPDNGPLWGKQALTYTLGNNPNWPGALDAAQHALDAGYDSALLRTVMASAEFGRAKLFTSAGRLDQADAANSRAKDYMARAAKLAPQDASADIAVSKLMAQNFISNGQFDDAANALDLVARQNPDDLELQKLYATTLSSVDNRQEDAFVAWANVWKLQGDDAVQLDANRYVSLANGFDKHIFNLAKAASMLTSSAAHGTIPASTALPQVQRYAAEIKNAMDALHSMRPPAGRLSTDVQVSRLIAGDLFSQAVQSYVLYLQNGDQNVLAHGGQLHFQAIDQLNNARKAQAAAS